MSARGKARKRALDVLYEADLRDRPPVEAPIAMGYVPAALSASGTRLEGEVRGKRLPVTVCDLPFRPSTYKR